MFTSTLFVSALAAAVSAQTPVFQGKNIIEPGAQDGICLTAEGTANGATVDIQPCRALANQAWLFTGGSVTIFNQTKCLDVKDGINEDGAALQLWDCTAGDVNQQWYYTTDNRLAWTDHGKCLDLTDGNLAAGSLPQIWTCTDNDANQVWDTAPVIGNASQTATTSFVSSTTTA